MCYASLSVHLSKFDLLYALSVSTLVHCFSMVSYFSKKHLGWVALIGVNVALIGANVAKNTMLKVILRLP